MCEFTFIPTLCSDNVFIWKTKDVSLMRRISSIRRKIIMLEPVLSASEQQRLVTSACCYIYHITTFCHCCSSHRCKQRKIFRGSSEIPRCTLWSPISPNCEAESTFQHFLGQCEKSIFISSFNLWPIWIIWTMHMGRVWCWHPSYDTVAEVNILIFLTLRLRNNMQTVDSGVIYR